MYSEHRGQVVMAFLEPRLIVVITLISIRLWRETLVSQTHHPPGPPAHVFMTSCVATPVAYMDSREPEGADLAFIL